MKCNLCGSEKNKFILKSKDRNHKTSAKYFRLVKCKICGLVFIDPPPTEKEITNSYPRNYLPHLEEKAIGKHEEPITRVDSGVKRFLDFGCGSGKLLDYQKSKHPNWAFYGLEINANACEIAQKKGFNVFCGALEKAPYEKNFFDLIIARHVLEHMPDPRNTLSRLYDLLKPGGEISITLPNISGLSIKLFKSYAFQLELPRHLYHFSPKTLEAMLRKENFEIQKVKFDGSPKVLARSIGFLLGRSWINPPSLLMKLFRPLSVIAARLGKSDVFSIRARKPL